MNDINKHWILYCTDFYFFYKNVIRQKYLMSYKNQNVHLMKT